MLERFKIIHHSHSGKLRPHEFTSYGPLAVLLVLVGVALMISSVQAASPPPQAESIGLTGRMPGPPPKTAATITSPTSGQRFTESPITVEGTCPAKTLVEIYKNDIFAGSGTCSDSGTFKFDIDLMYGANTLIAKVYDELNQPGPDSAPVNIFYDASPPQGAPLAGLNFGGPQLLLSTDSVYRGIFPGKELSVPISILGGTPPFALNIQWGDNNNKLIPRDNNTPFKANHTYKKPGNYPITMQATDAVGRVAFLSVVAIVNGQPSGTGISSTVAPPTNKLLALWPLYTSAVAIVISFWLGERREKHILESRQYPTQRTA